MLRPRIAVVGIVAIVGAWELIALLRLWLRYRRPDILRRSVQIEIDIHSLELGRINNLMRMGHLFRNIQRKRRIHAITHAIDQAKPVVILWDRWNFIACVQLSVGRNGRNYVSYIRFKASTLLFHHVSNCG